MKIIFLSNEIVDFELLRKEWMDTVREHVKSGLIHTNNSKTNRTNRTGEWGERGIIFRGLHRIPPRAPLKVNFVKSSHFLRIVVLFNFHAKFNKLNHLTFSTSHFIRIVILFNFHVKLIEQIKVRPFSNGLFQYICQTRWCTSYI